MLDFSWSKNCIISEILNNAEVPDNPTGNQLVEHIPEGSPTYASFEINNVKLNVPVVTLPINDIIEF